LRERYSTLIFNYIRSVFVQYSLVLRYGRRKLWWRRECCWTSQWLLLEIWVSLERVLPDFDFSAVRQSRWL